MKAHRRSSPLAAALVALSGAAALAAAPAAQAHDLTIEVVNPRVADGKPAGNLFAAVYADPAVWMKDGRELQGVRAPTEETTTLVVRGLPAGRYAVSAFQDANGNGKFDTNIVGIPTEPYGFSRDAAGRMGPPSFDAASIDLQADTVIRITLR